MMALPLEGLLDLLVWALPYLILALLPGMFLYASLRTRMKEARLRRRLERFAADNGFAFEPRPASDIHERFEVSHKLDRFEPFGSGWHRSSRNSVWGARGGIHWQIFDYHCRSNVNRGGSTMEDYTIVSASVGVSFPRTTVRSQNLFHRFMSLVGFDDIRTGDDRFDRRFRLDCEDPQFVHALLQPEMKHLLENTRHRCWQLGSPGILIFLKGHAPAHRITAAMKEIEEFVTCIPKHLLTSEQPVERQSPHRLRNG